MGMPAKVKWIPIEWHSVLHTQTDEYILFYILLLSSLLLIVYFLFYFFKLNRHVVKVTPKGMTGPRSFINNTLIDILFWASPYGYELF